MDPGRLPEGERPGSVSRGPAGMVAATADGGEAPAGGCDVTAGGCDVAAGGCDVAAGDWDIAAGGCRRKPCGAWSASASSDLFERDSPVILTLSAGQCYLPPVQKALFGAGG